MAVASGGALLDILQQHQILEPAQMEELRRRFTKRVPGPQKLVQELMRCRWLTPFQANLILQGKAKELILGSYVLLERLGAGGMGQVFKARHLHMRRLVALKIIRPEVASDADSLARFYREIQVTSQVDHPNVVRAYDAGPVGPHLGLAMEFIEGTDLAALVNKEGPLSVEQACDFVRQTALGLQHIHERGLIHRDMKPPNLVVTKECDASEYPYGQIKILDLGLARLRQPERDPSSRNLTQLAGDYVTMGTPDYLSPEQALDLHSADIRSDIYSLGCIFYFLLKGKPPFAGGSLAEKLMRHQKASPPPLEVPNAPPQLEAIIHRMLAKRPVERFPAPIDVVQAIDQLPLRKKKSVSSQWAKKSAVWLLRQPFRIAKWSLKQAAKLPPRVKITAAGVCLLLVAAFVGYRSFFPADTSVSDKKPGRQHQVGGDLSTSVPFSIPVERRQKWYPAELVGIIGDDRWRQAHSVISLAFCPDGRTFASSSTNGIFVWDSETGKLVSHRKAEPGEVLTIAFLDASRIVALKRYSNVITIWDWQTKTEKKHLLPVGNVTTIAASPDGKAVVVGGNQDALVFNVERGVRLQSYRSASSSSNFSVGFSRKGAKFASGRTGVKLWDVSAGREISLQSTVPDFSQKAVGKLAFSEDGRFFAAAVRSDKTGSNRTVLASVVGVWDAESGAEVGAFPLDGLVNGLAVDSASNSLAIGRIAQKGGDSVYQVLRTSLVGKKRTVLGEGSARFYALAFSRDGKRLAAGDSNGNLRIWNMTTNKELLPRQPIDSVAALAVTDDGQSLVTANHQTPTRLLLRDLRTTETKATFSYHPRFGSARMLLAGATLVSYSANGLKAWNIESKGEYPDPMAGWTSISDASLSADGQWLAVAVRRIEGNKRTAGLITFNTSTGQKKLLIYDGDFFKITIAPNARSIVLYHQDSANNNARFLLFIDQLTGAEHPVPLAKDDAVYALAIAPDNQTAAVALRRQVQHQSTFEVSLWDVEQRKQKKVLGGEYDNISYLRFGPASDILAGWSSRSLVIWDTHSGRIIQSFDGYFELESVCFSRDGRFLAAGTRDGNLYVFDLKKRALARQWRLLFPVNALDFDKDGKHLLCAAANGVIYIFDLAR